MDGVSTPSDARGHIVTRHVSVAVNAILTCLACLSQPAFADLPHRRFTIEIRQVFEGEASGYTARTQPERPLMATQRVRVNNGERAQLAVHLSEPMQWAQRAESYATAASPVGASPTGAGVTTSLIWMEDSQSVEVSPRWKGVGSEISLSVEIRSAATDQRAGSILPGQLRGTLKTLLNIAVGDWVTLATEGRDRTDGTYSSASTGERVRVVQVRITPD